MRTISQEDAKVVILGGIDPTTGGVALNGSALGPALKQYGGVTSSIVTNNGSAGDIPAGGKMFIQNNAATALYVAYSTSSASASNFAFTLKACSVADDGTGGSKDIADYVGRVTILAATGSPRAAVSIFS